MLHQIDFAKARPGVVPVGEGANRNLVFEQRTGLGPTSMLRRLGAEDAPNAIHAGRTDALQVLKTLAAKAKVALVT